MLKRTWPVAVALVALLATGYVHGRWTGRWSHGSDAFAQASARLQRVPLVVGDWKSEDDGGKLKELGVGEDVVYLDRTYVDQRTGERVAIMLMCGHFGPVSTHPPEACYPGAGYQIGAARTRRSVADGDSFWVRKMTKPGPVSSEQIVIYYAWSTDGRWEAPQGDPRLQFAQIPVLYKLYVIRPITGPAVESGPGGGADPALDFLGAFLPELRRQLFPASPAA